MKRRTFACLLASLAGCTTGGGETDATSVSSDASATPTDEVSATTSTVEPSPTTVVPSGSRTGTTATPSGLRDLGLRFEVDERTPATESAPGSFRASLVNEGSSTVSFMHGEVPPLSRLEGSHRTKNAIVDLLPQHDSGWGIADANDDGRTRLLRETRDGECWNRIDSVVVGEVLQETTLAPGDRLAGRYEIVAPPDTCPPDGTYLFDQSLLAGGGDVTWTARIEYPLS